MPCCCAAAAPLLGPSPRSQPEQVLCQGSVPRLQLGHAALQALDRLRSGHQLQALVRSGKGGDEVGCVGMLQREKQEVDGGQSMALSATHTLCEKRVHHGMTCVIHDCATR